jgi:Protein of unknown function (DUF3551)
MRAPRDTATRSLLGLLALALLGLGAGPPSTPVYRWCVRSKSAINCHFQSQTDCMAAARRLGAACELNVIVEPDKKRR